MDTNASFPSFDPKPTEEQNSKDSIPREQELESVEKKLDSNQGEPANQDSPILDPDSPSEVEPSTQKECPATVLLEEHQKIVQERNEFLNHLQRLQAEFDNYRKRVQKEKSELRDFLIQDFIYRMLGVIDNMDRAMHPSNTTNDVNSYRQGVEMVFQQLMGVLKEQGLSRIESVGNPFDPRFHEAIGHVECEEVSPGSIASEFMPGYMINDRLLRASKVLVAKPPQPPSGDKSEVNQKQETTE